MIKQKTNKREKKTICNYTRIMKRMAGEMRTTGWLAINNFVVLKHFKSFQGRLQIA